MDGEVKIQEDEYDPVMKLAKQLMIELDFKSLPKTTGTDMGNLEYRQKASQNLFI